MFTINGSKVVPKQLQDQLRENSQELLDKFGADEMTIIANSFATLGLLSQAPICIQQFYSPVAVYSRDYALQRLVDFLFSKYAINLIPHQQLLTLQRQFFLDALDCSHDRLGAFAALYLDQIQLPQEKLRKLIYKYMDPSYVCPQSLLCFRLYAYRNLRELDNELHIFTYALLWGLCDLEMFAIYLKLDYVNPVIQLCQLELLIRLKAALLSDQECCTTCKLLDIYQNGPAVQQNIIGLTYPLGLQQIGSRWYFPQISDILSFQCQMGSFQPEYLQTLLNRVNDYPISIGKLNQLLQIRTDPLPPLTSQEYKPLTQYQFGCTPSEIGTYLSNTLPQLANEVFQQRCLPYIDFISLTNLYGSTSVEFQLSGMPFLQALETRLEKGLTDRISLPSVSTTDRTAYYNVSMLLQVISLLDIKPGNKLLISRKLFNTLQIFREDRHPNQLNEFLRRLELLDVLVDAQPEPPQPVQKPLPRGRHSSRSKAQQSQEDDSTNQQPKPNLVRQRGDLPPQIFGLSFMPAFYLTATVFFGLPLQPLFGGLLAFLMYPSQQCLFGLLHKFSASFYMRRGDNSFNMEIQAFSRVVYYNMLHQLLSHCDDLHSLLSLFALHVDLNCASAEARHYFYLLKQKYFDVPKHFTLPKSGSDADPVVLEQMTFFALGEKIDFIAAAQAITTAKQPGQLISRLQPLATAYLVQLFNFAAGVPAPGGGVILSRKSSIATSAALPDAIIQTTNDAFFKRFDAPWAGQIESVLGLLNSPIAISSRQLVAKNMVLSAQELDLFPINVARLFLELFDPTVMNYVFFKLVFMEHFIKFPNFAATLKQCDQAWSPQNWIYEDYFTIWQYRPRLPVGKKWLSTQHFPKAILEMTAQKFGNLGFTLPPSSDFWD